MRNNRKQYLISVVFTAFAACAQPVNNGSSGKRDAFMTTDGGVASHPDLDSPKPDLTLRPNCGGLTLCDNVCVDIIDDPKNCGGCGIQCSDANMETVTCQNVCNGVCWPGFADCNGNKKADGCETDLDNDLHNCGACGNVCGTNTVCVSARCVSACENGHSLCKGTCVDTASDSDNCGACGNVCGHDAKCVGARCVSCAAVGAGIYLPSTGTWRVGFDLDANPSVVIDVTVTTDKWFDVPDANSVWAWIYPWGTALPADVKCHNRCGDEVAPEISGDIALCNTDAK